ncbi:rhodanese-like domain-containing protein, partial [Kingella kingae]
PVDAITAQIAKVEPNKNAPVNLYCRSGRRAEVALQELRKMGYTNVTNYGGYQDLLAKGIR